VGSDDFNNTDHSFLYAPAENLADSTPANHETGRRPSKRARAARALDFAT